jgi:hypothetical protein
MAMIVAAAGDTRDECPARGSAHELDNLVRRGE